jgi:hypothetical protein
LVVGLVLAGTLSAGLVQSAVPAYAATTAPAAGSAKLATFCSSLADAIARLEALKPSPLRNALLAFLVRAQSAYCS